MRILVTGSRHWTDQRIIYHALLDQWALNGKPKDMTLVHGAATGTDVVAAMIAKSWGWRVEPHRVTADDWEREGKVAGFNRNQRMVDLGADVCLAFIAVCVKPTCRRPRPHDSHGAADCAERADEAGIRTLRRRL